MAKRRTKPLTKRTTITLSVDVLRHVTKLRDNANMREGRKGKNALSLGDVVNRMLEAAPYVRADGIVVEPLKPHPPIQSISGVRRVVYLAACSVAMKAADIKLETSHYII